MLLQAFPFLIFPIFLPLEGVMGIIKKNPKKLRYQY